MPSNHPKIHKVVGSGLSLSFAWSPNAHSLACSRVEYRALEGFVLAVSPFNFTAIGGNLCGGISQCCFGHVVYLMLCFWCAAPALVGNVVIWKPSPMAVYANYLTHKSLLGGGLPPSVIQFVPGPAPDIVKQAIGHRDFAGLHFTGSTLVFKSLWKDIANNLDKYKGYPRIVGETGTSTALVVMVLIFMSETLSPKGERISISYMHRQTCTMRSNNPSGRHLNTKGKSVPRCHVYMSPLRSGIRVSENN